jgi:hypothetical protein
VTAREQAIEAGAWALYRPDIYVVSQEAAKRMAAAVVDAAEPIIRAEYANFVPKVFEERRLVATRAAVAEEIAQAIEADCLHARMFRSIDSCCYRCADAAAIARRIGGTP